MIKFECKDTVFFGYMQIFLYFCRKFCNIMTLDEYISGHSSPENAVLEAITRDTYVHVLNPHMLSGHVQGRVLSMISHMIRPKRILELGTFTGYSALCLAEGLAEGGKLVTIEHNDELEETIRRNISRSPLGEKIELVIGDAKEILSTLNFQLLTSKWHQSKGRLNGATYFFVLYTSKRGCIFAATSEQNKHKLFLAENLSRTTK